MWTSGKPNNLQGYQFCVARLIDGWNDKFCNELRRFVCEISKGLYAVLIKITQTFTLIIKKKNRLIYHESKEYF